MHPILNIGIRAARAAGRLIARQIDRAYALTIETKQRNDFVTEIDRQAERIIIDTIQRSYPGHGFRAEESGTQGDDQNVWIIDPLDGTTNFIHGFPQVAVSIAFEHKGRIEQGVIFDPLRQELFTASHGAGAQLDDRRIRVSPCRNLDQALIGTGFPFRDMEHLDEYMAALKAVVSQCAGVRRVGAAALDLAWVAAGRLDGFWELGLREWDIAAGGLMIKEAGGMISAANGSDDWLQSGNVATGNPRIHKALLQTIKPLFGNSVDT